MTKEGSTNIVNFMTSRAGVLMLGVVIYVIIVIMYYLYQYTTHCMIATVLKDYVAACLPIRSLIFIYYMMGLFIYKYEPF